MGAVTRARAKKKPAKKPVKKASAKKAVKKAPAKNPSGIGSKIAMKMKCSACGASWLVGKVNVKTKGRHACIKCGKKTAKQA